MNVTDRVANLLIGSRGNTYCDDCISFNLALDEPETGSAGYPVLLPTSRRFGGVSARVHCAVAKRPLSVRTDGQPSANLCLRV